MRYLDDCPEEAETQRPKESTHLGDVSLPEKLPGAETFVKKIRRQTEETVESD